MSSKRMIFVILSIAVSSILCTACGFGEPTVIPTATTIPIVIPSTPTPLPSSEELQSSLYLYQLIITRCTFEPETPRYQTAFKLKGVAGLVTALHGVADCPMISAFPANNSAPEYEYLRITHIDVSRDIAVVANSDSTRIDEGFELASDRIFRRPCGNLHPNDPQMYITGYPVPNDELVIDDSPYVDCIRPLINRVPIRDLQLWLEDKGISMGASIFDVQSANVQHGHSGAPLLMYDRVSNKPLLLGIIIGRLLDFPKDGFPNYTNPNGWAIVPSELELRGVGEAANDLQKFASMNVGSKFELAMMFAAKPVKLSANLYMQTSQPWSSSFTIDQLFVPQDSCVAVYSEDYSSPNTVLLALTPFKSGENRPKLSVGAIWGIPQPQVELYRQFCSSLVSASTITLHAYLMQQQNGECTDKLVQQSGAYIADTFEVTIQADATDIGVCSTVD